MRLAGCGLFVNVCSLCVGCWLSLVCVGCCSLAVARCSQFRVCGLVCVGCLLSFVVACFLVFCLLFVVLYSLPVVRCVFFVDRVSMFVVRCAVFGVRCLLFVVPCSLFVVGLLVA